MKKVWQYFNLIKLSFLNIKSNPVVIVPDIIMMVYVFASSKIFYKTSGIEGFLSQTLSPGNFSGLFEDFMATSAVQFLVSALIFFVVTFFIGTGLVAWKYIMIKDVVNGAKANLFLAIKKSKIYFWRIVGLKLLVYIIGFIMILAAMFVSWVFYILLKPSTANAWVYTLLIFGVLIVLISLFIVISLLFRYQVLLFKNKNSILTLRYAFNFFKAHKRISLEFFIVAALFALVALIIAFPLNYLANVASLKNLVVIAGVVSFVTAFIKVFANIVSEVFLFNGYKMLESKEGIDAK